MSSIPERIGRYSILERLAVGGMAVVYLGFETGDSALQRLVVIKQILPQYDEDDGFQRALAASRASPDRLEWLFSLGAVCRKPRGPKSPPRACRAWRVKPEE